MAGDVTKGYLRDSPYMPGRAWPDDLNHVRQTSGNSFRPQVGVHSALDIVSLFRGNHLRVVLTSGTFDLFNIGHEQY
jgi:hypothetical protein